MFSLIFKHFSRISSSSLASCLYFKTAQKMQMHMSFPSWHSTDIKRVNIVEITYVYENTLIQHQNKVEHQMAKVMLAHHKFNINISPFQNNFWVVKLYYLYSTFQLKYASDIDSTASVKRDRLETSKQGLTWGSLVE